MIENLIDKKACEMKNNILNENMNYIKIFLLDIVLWFL